MDGPSYSTGPGPSTPRLSLAGVGRSLGLVRLVSVAMLLAFAASLSAAGDRARTDVDVIVPVPPTEHQRLHYFGRRNHHLVPGRVTINARPYVCDLDKKSLIDRDEFVAHIRTVHHTPPWQDPRLAPGPGPAGPLHRRVAGDLEMAR